MNMHAVLQGTTLLGFAFILGLVYGRARQDPANGAFRLFLWFAMGWTACSFALVLPQSQGLELILKRASALCWLPASFFFLRFVYLLIHRKRDLAYYLLAACVAAGCVIYISTDLAIEGFDRYAWGVAVARGPLHSTIATVAVTNGVCAMLLLWRESRRTDHPGQRKTLLLLSAGGTVALGVIFATMMFAQLFLGRKDFPQLGSYGLFLLCPFLYRAVTHHGFLSISLPEVAEKLFEDLRDGIVLTDREGVIIKINSAAAAMLGCPPETSALRYLKTLLPGYHPTSNAYSGEFATKRDGTDRFVSFSQSRSTKDGFDQGDVVVLRDVTEEKRAKEVLLRSRDELKAEVATRTEELRHSQKLEAIGTLAGGVAHDFNNILAAIVGFATAAKEELPEGHDLHQDLAEILKAAGRARDIVRQLLSFSRRNEPKKRTVDVNDVVCESIPLLQASLPATLELAFTRSPGRCATIADPTQLQQVILNLATNAWHAMAETGGKLSIDVQELAIDAEFAQQHPPLKAGSAVCITATDAGHGMSPEVLARIFDPFFTTKDASQGTGLGLATAMRIVQEHQGTIVVESTIGIGSTFRVYLPRSDHDLLAESIGDLVAPRGTEHLLIIDDSEPVAASMARMLHPLGYRITSFVDPERALAAFRSAPADYDLVVTDLTMPRLTGMVLAEKLTAIRPDLPVLLVSGYPPPGALTSQPTARVKAFLAKPLERAQLAQTVRHLLDGKCIPWVSPVEAPSFGGVVGQLSPPAPAG